jgi:hypothetical protein
MSWLFSQALVEEYSEVTSSDGELSAPLSGNPTQLAYLPPDRMTAFSRLSRFGMTFKPLTESLGRDVLTSYLEDFPVRTFLPLERAQASKEPDRECGVTWRELLARYDLNTSMWRTAQCSLLEDSIEFSGIWPRWGLMQDGVSYRQQTLVRHTKGTESGLWRTPQAGDSRSSKIQKGHQINLAHQVLKWPTPRTKGMCGGSGAWNQLNKATTPEEARQMGAGNGGTLNPTWVEWLMGWPLGWTDLKPLEMDKYQQWRQQHGIF